MSESELPPIQDYSFGSIRIGGTAYSSDVIILPGRILPDWWREKGHSLAVADLEEVFEARPELLIVGSGAYGRMDVPAATRSALEGAGIELIAEPTGAACATYNGLRADRQVAAALHLTC